MARADVLRVMGTARLAADPELRNLPSGTSVCKLRLAWSNARKVDGEWKPVSSFIDMTVWGSSGEACAKYLEKGRQIVFIARLEQRSWETESGSRRYVHELTAEDVQFVGGGDREGSGSSSNGDSGGFTPRQGEVGDFPAPTGGRPGADDDIPF